MQIDAKLSHELLLDLHITINFPLETLQIHWWCHFHFSSWS